MIQVMYFLLLPWSYFYRFATIRKFVSFLTLLKNYTFILCFSNSPPGFIQNLVYFLISMTITLSSFYTVNRAYCNIDYSNRVESANLWYEEVPVPQLVVGMNVSIYLYAILKYVKSMN